VSHAYDFFFSHRRASHNVPLLLRAAVVAIKRQQQAVDDGVPPPSHNARVQLHRDEYASRGIDGACDSRLIIFVDVVGEMNLVEDRK